LKIRDSSALLPLIFREETSESVANLVRDDGDMAVWWGTWVECAAAISRLKREKGFDDETEAWYEVEPTSGLRLLTMTVSRDHRLKAADCLQLASALRWCEGDSKGAGFVCLDEQLGRAAREEDFDVLPGPKTG
jgi:predicted nucleic acid-binding protein